VGRRTEERRGGRKELKLEDEEEVEEKDKGNFEFLELQWT